MLPWGYPGHVDQGKLKLGARLQSIRRYLLLRIVALVVFAIVSFAVVAYVLVLRPAQDERARVEMRRSAAVVGTDVTALIGHIRRRLGTGRDFGRNGLYRFDRPLEFAKLLIPIINVRPQISNILFADTSGRAMQIARLPDGTWQIRETDVERLGTLQRQTALSEAGTYVSET